MAKDRSERLKDPVALSSDLIAMACRAANEAGGAADAKPFVSLPDGESQLRKEFETLSERIYVEGRDDSFDPKLIELTAIRVAAGALRLAAMVGGSK